MGEESIGLQLRVVLDLRAPALISPRPTRAPTSPRTRWLSTLEGVARPIHFARCTLLFIAVTRYMSRARVVARRVRRDGLFAHVNNRERERKREKRGSY